MRVAMLGSDYRYAAMPTYSQANGRGYVSGVVKPGSLNGTMMGASEPATDQDVQEIYAIMAANPQANDGKGMTWDQALAQWQSQKGTSKVVQITETANSILESLAKGFITVKQAIDQASASGDTTTAMQVQSAVGWKQYLPWMIVGGAGLVAILLIMGTRKRRSR